MITKKDFDFSDLCDMKGLSNSFSKFYLTPLIKSKILKSETINFAKPISEKNLLKFLEILFNKERGNLILQELNQLLEVKNNQFYLALDDTNFIVIANLKPTENNLTIKGRIISYLTFIPYFISLGFIPKFEEKKINPSFYIFNRDLELLKEFHFENKYWTRRVNHYYFSSGKKSEELIPDFRLVKKPILEFKEELKKFCKENDCGEIEDNQE